MKDMVKKKAMIAKECKIQDDISEKLLKNKSKLDQLILTIIAKSKEEIVMLEDEIEKLKTNQSGNRTQIQPDINNEDDTRIELTRQSNLKLLSYIEQQISSKECPLCLEVASSPIFMCQEQHLVCGACRPRLQACPECRLNYIGQKRHRYNFVSSPSLLS